MRQTLSILAAVGLLVALGALAVLALPTGQVALSPAPVAAQAAAGPEGVLATNRVNVIAIPLDTTNQFSNAGKSFNADGLAAIAGAGVVQVLEWNASTNSYRSWDPIEQDGDNFPLKVGGVYRLVLDSTANTVISLVGDVPDEGSVTFDLVRAAGSGCRINDISIPLDRADITNADELAASVGNVSQVLEWNASTNSYRTWDPVEQDGDNFSTRIGYPYRLCLSEDGAITWPTP